EGAFEVAGLPAGSYLVEVTAAGFQTATVEPVELGSGATRDLDVTLGVAAVAEQVTVTASGTPQAPDEVAKSVGVVDREEAEARGCVALPEALTGLAGVRVQRQGGPGSLTAIRIRGFRTQDTAVLVDGLRVRRLRPL